MKRFAYLFEAHSIQSYIMNGGKLADMVGASELLESLLAKNGPLDDILEAGGFSTKEYQFSRRGGGAFYILFKEMVQANKLRDIWSLVVQGFIPGLPYVHCVSEGDTPKSAIANAKDMLTVLRSKPTPLSLQPGPLIQRTPRTGEPANEEDTHTDPDPWLRKYWEPVHWTL